MVKLLAFTTMDRHESSIAWKPLQHLNVHWLGLHFCCNLHQGTIMHVDSLSPQWKGFHMKARHWVVKKCLLFVNQLYPNIVRLTTVEEFDEQSAPGQPLELLVKRLLEINDFQHMEIDDSNTWQTIVSSTQSGLPSSDRNPDPLICHKLVLLPALWWC